VDGCAKKQPHLQVPVDLEMAGSPDMSGVAQAGVAVTPHLIVAELINALPSLANPAAQIRSIINGYA
jgi:hypothetical protein